VKSKTKPVLAKAIETSAEALVVITDEGSVSIPWAKCSERLARASTMERRQARLSPSGYGISWPLIDEDLAVGALIRCVANGSQVLARMQAVARPMGGWGHEGEHDIYPAAPQMISERGGGTAEPRGSNQHQSVCGDSGGGEGFGAADGKVLRRPEGAGGFRGVR